MWNDFKRQSSSLWFKEGDVYLISTDRYQRREMSCYKLNFISLQSKRLLQILKQQSNILVSLWVPSFVCWCFGTVDTAAQCVCVFMCVCGRVIRQTAPAGGLTAGAIGSSPAGFTLTGVGGHAAAVHAFLSTMCWGRRDQRGRKKEKEKTRETQVKFHSFKCM